MLDTLIDVAGHLAAWAVLALFMVWGLEKYTDWRRK